MTAVANVVDDGVPEHDGICSTVSESAYHADRGSLSFSGAKLLLPPSSPAHFREYMDGPRKTKREWDFGHMTHRIVLGKGAEIAVLDPEVHGRLKSGALARSPRSTDMWKEAEADARARGETPVHIDEYRAAMAMVEKVREHPVAGPLFRRGHSEVAMYYTDPLTGVRLRGRADWITVLNGRLWIVDYKSALTARPEDFGRTASNLAYHMQAAWYSDLVTAIGWARYPVFVFAVQEKAAPHVVTVLEPDAEAMAEGRAANRRAINLYAECQASGQWPAYPGADEVQPFSLPAWAIRRTTVDDLLTDEFDDYQGDQPA